MITDSFLWQFGGMNLIKEWLFIWLIINSQQKEETYIAW